MNSIFADSFFWAEVLLAVKAIAFILSVLLAFGIIYSARKTFLLLKPKVKVPGRIVPEAPAELPVSDEIIGKEFTGEWWRIARRAESGLEQDMALAIIEADNLVDDVLKSLGYEGEGLADRLKRIDSGRVKSIDALWEAHKVRNNIVHVTGFKVTQNEARRVLASFQRALEELGAI